MAITLTHVPTGATQTIPLVLGYQSDRTVPTVVHSLIGIANPDFTVKPPGPRAGTFRMFCTSESTATTLATFLARTGPFTLTDTGTTLANTTFLVTGRITYELDEQTWLRCVVSVEYTETAL